MKFLFLILLLITSNTVFAQVMPDCKYPFDKSADSLVKFVIKDTYKYNTYREVETKFKSQELRLHYDPTIRINYDSVFHVCISYLRTRLGDKLLCNNIALYINSFSISGEKDTFTLAFGFTYPVIKREKPENVGTSISYYETTNFAFEYGLTPNRKLFIKYPLDVPNCNNKQDCGIVVTREKALGILKAQNAIKPNDRINMQLFGTHWDIQLTEDGWLFRNYSINIQTGELTKVGDSRRID